ncbi:MAG TPA: citrate transporter [Burkholderiales bacterium]|nr:citrate transporter [Burkholderiales bacterium]
MRQWVDGLSRERRLRALAASSLAAYSPLAAAAGQAPALLGIPIDFILFGMTLLGVALLHRHTLYVALAGLGAIAGYKLFFTGFKTGTGVPGLLAHLAHEWVILANLACLLLGFALLSRQFEDSKVPAVLPKFLPGGWKGAFGLLAMVFVLSSFLDNIAAALIGGAMAHTVFRGKVHIGYLAAIVAASNAGGSGSVVGDTTTTMMWIAGVSPLAVLHAYIAAAVALIVCGIPAALQQDKHSPIMKYEPGGAQVDWMRVGIFGFVLVTAISANLYVNVLHADISERFPFIGASVLLAILATAWLRKPEWGLLPEAAKGTVFLLALVTSASMMPVEKLPAASWQTAFSLGFISAVFDNIPLTALALKQGGYDWGMLAYTVGFGGSMIWFGSSAGVALSNMYPEARNVGRWLYHGWHVTAAYVVGFFVLLAALGWQPTPKRDERPPAPPAASAPHHASAVAGPARIAGSSPAARTAVLS